MHCSSRANPCAVDLPFATCQLQRLPLQLTLWLPVLHSTLLAATRMEVIPGAAAAAAAVMEGGARLAVEVDGPQHFSCEQPSGSFARLHPPPARFSGRSAGRSTRCTRQAQLQTPPATLPRCAPCLPSFLPTRCFPAAPSQPSSCSQRAARAAGLHLHAERAARVCRLARRLHPIQRLGTAGGAAGEAGVAAGGGWGGGCGVGWCKVVKLD